MGTCFGIIATVHAFDIDMSAISELCEKGSGLSGLVVIVNYPHRPSAPKYSHWCSGIEIIVIEACDYIGSAEAFRRGIVAAQSMGADAVLLLDEDCFMTTTACNALCEAVRSHAIVSANRNTHRETWVVPGTIRVLRRANTSQNMLCGWAGMAINLTQIPEWDRWLRQLGETLWFYWDDYTFVAWTMQQGLSVRGFDQITYESPNLPRRTRSSWRSYYESRNGVWFARLTMSGWPRWKFVLLWFIEYVVAVGIRDRKLRQTWTGFRDGVSGIVGRTADPWS